MKFLKYTAYVLVLVGALNWGLIGLFNFDLVAFLFGEMTLLTRAIYTIVGLSAIYAAITVRQCERIEQIESCEYGHCG